jgi:hypothetical protein
MDHMLESAFHEAEAEAEASGGFEDAWDEAEMETAWKEFSQPQETPFDHEKMMEAWQEAAEKYRLDKRTYKMTEGNPYLDAANPMSVAKQKLADGEIQEGILALEAEAQLRPDNSEAWLLLG